MRLTRTGCKPRFADRRTSAFTLVEVLAALLFLAIVIPVAMQGLRIAGMAGAVAERKAAAARVAERVLNELIVTGDWEHAGSGGVVREGRHEFRWRLQRISWSRDAMQQLTVQVSYLVQGVEHDVRLTTLAEPSSTIQAQTAKTSASSTSR